MGGTQEEAHGPDQEAEEEEEGGSRQREARRGEDPPQEHGHCPRDDWIHCWSLQPEALSKKPAPSLCFFEQQKCILSPVPQHFLVSSAATVVLNILALMQPHYCRKKDGRSE